MFNLFCKISVKHLIACLIFTKLAITSNFGRNIKSQLAIILSKGEPESQNMNHKGSTMQLLQTEVMYHGK